MSVTMNGLHHPQLGDPVAVYEYRNLAGETLFGNARFEEPKDFRVFTPAGNGKYRWSIEGAPKLLYQLPRLEEALVKGETIWIVDGEKDADALCDRGLPATCCARAQGWSLELADQLIGVRRVRIVADNDGGPGMRQAQEVRDLLLQVTGIGSHEIEIVQAAAGKDAYDHFDAGYGLEEFELVNEDQVLGIEEPPENPIVFETLRAFLERDVPKSESLVGVTRDGTNLLPRYGWVMPWGKEGSGKTSIMVDLLFHACAGIDWLQYPIGRELKVVAIVNEGVPGGLQDKLRQKTERWEHNDSVLDNLAVYASPWGEFTFANERMVQHAKDFARDFGADYVALDPLHTLGTTGVGSPVETEAFKHLLRDFGLWDWIGVITAHHSNKSGMLSGDWGRHPDTVILLEKDGKNPTTKFTLHKARPADPTELGVPCLLDWTVESLGYTRREINQVPSFDEEAGLAKALEVLETADAPLGKEALVGAIGGNAAACRRALEGWISTKQIINLTPEKRSFKLTVPSYVQEAQTDLDATALHGAERRMVGKESYVSDQQTQLDEQGESPESTELRLRPPPYKGVDERDVTERGDQDDIELDWS